MFKNLDVGIVSALDVIINMASKTVKGKVSDYCDLDATCAEKHKMIAKDGSMATVFRVMGSRNISSERELHRIVEIFSSISPAFKEDGHQIQFVFCRDKGRIEEEIRRTLSLTQRRAEQLGMYVDDLIESKVKNIVERGTYESNYMVLWTRPSVIKVNQKEEFKSILDNKKGLPPALNSQDLLNFMEAVDLKHNAFINLVINSLNAANVVFRPLDVDSAIREIRKSINNNLVSDNWTPYTVYDQPPLREPTKDQLSLKETDVGEGLWPSLSSQIAPAELRKINYDTIAFGDKYISSISVLLAPKLKNTYFNKLVANIADDIPYQISMMVSGGALASMSLKALFAALLTVTNKSHNLPIKDSIEALKKYEEGGNLVKTSINVSTWADSQKALKSRKERLLKAIQSWGDTDAKISIGDAAEAYLSTVPAVMFKPEAPAFSIPAKEMFTMLPLARTSNVWEFGSIVNLTNDGKLSPYQTMSSLQNTWNSVIFATPGSGKSARLNAENMATILTPSDTNDIPYIGIIDMGFSSLGLINSLKERFPKEKSHLFTYQKLQNTLDYAMNVFDTYLGCREPTPFDKSFLVNFISTIIGADDEAFQLDKMVSTVIDLVYKKYSDSDTGRPKRYINSQSREVDEVLEKHNIDAKGRSWWFVVDELFERKEIHAAKLAQRFAVPLLEDCVAIAESEDVIKSIYSKPKVSTGETALEFFSRAISEAISMYPILSQPTVFDLGEAKVISLDLNDVGKTTGSKTDNRRAATMFMLGRYIIGKNIKQDASLYSVSPKKYHKYHQKNIETNETLVKKICIDEFHNAAKIPSFVSQVITDMREGRKWKLEIVLVSQQYTDFSKEILDNATTIQILSGGDSSKELASTFTLDESAESIIRSRLNGPTSKGVPHIFKTITKEGIFVQYLYGYLCPLEILSYSTTQEDLRIVREVSKRIGYLSALSEVANRYPRGFKRFLEDAYSKVDNYDDLDDSNAYEKEANLIAREFNERRMRQ